MATVTVNFGGFQGGLLRIARKATNFLALDLGDLSRVDPVSISRLENRTTVGPRTSTVKALARALEWPLNFFYGNNIHEPDPDYATFRSKTTIRARHRDMALAGASLGLLIEDWVQKKYPDHLVSEHNIIDLSEYQDDPGLAAETLREEWELGDKPIENMVHLLEANGVRVFSLSIKNAPELDAFSYWHDDVPYVFLNTVKTPERSRFDCAHELGHLCMHEYGDLPKRAEAQADVFAASFLAPEDAVVAYADAYLSGSPRSSSGRILPKGTRRAGRNYNDAPMSIHQLIEAKYHWGISLQAMVYRLQELGILNGQQARHFFRDIKVPANAFVPSRYSARWERSKMSSKIFDDVGTLPLEEWKEGRRRVAHEMNLPLKILGALVFQSLGPG